MLESLSSQPNLNQSISNFSRGNPTAEEVDIKEYISLFLRNWYWFVLCLVLGLFTAWVYLKYQTVIYKVRASVLFEPESQEKMSQEAIFQELTGNRYYHYNQMEDKLLFLRSSQLMEDVVDSLDLHISYYRQDRFQETELYNFSGFKVYGLDSTQIFKRQHDFIIYPNDNGSLTIQRSKEDTVTISFGEYFKDNEEWLSLSSFDSKVLRAPFRVSIVDPASAASTLSSQIEFAQSMTSSLLNVTMNSPFPEKAKEVIFTLIHFYNLRTIEKKNLSGEQTMSFIQDRLEYITEELYNVEKEVEGFKRQNQIPGDPNSQVITYFEDLKNIDKEIAELDFQLEILKKTQRLLLNSERKKLPFDTDLFSTSLSAYIKTYNEILFERNNFLESATANNPAVITYEEKLLNLEENILVSIKSKTEDIEGRKQRLKRQVNPLEQKISNIPRIERQLLQIMRQQQIKEKLFLFLLQKREEIALRKAAQTADLQIIETPELSGIVRPKHMQIYLMSGGLGLLLPGIVLLVGFYFDDKIKSKDYILEKSSIPYLGSIAMAADSENKLVVQKNNTSSVAEMFRLIRTNIRYNAGDSKNQVILITSSISGEGKTFVALNIGASLAISNRKVLILGLDLRKPKLAKYIHGNKDSKGLTNFLVGETNIDALIQPVSGQEGLYYIDSGPIPPNPSELLMSDYLKVQIEKLREEYDTIVIDSPPISLVTDTFILGEMADQTIVVTRYNYTPKALISSLQRSYEQNKLPKMGILFNGVKKISKYSYGYYSDENKKTRQFWKK